MSDMEERGWGNVRFRSRKHVPNGAPEDWANTRFVIGVVIFLAAAFAYPWYSYWVQSHLLARDIEQGMEEASRQFDAELRNANAAVEARTAARTLQSARQRVAAVRVAGVSHSSGSPVVVVKLGEASLGESKEVICRQAEGWLSEDLTGRSIRVQQHRGNATSDIGTIRC